MSNVIPLLPPHATVWFENDDYKIVRIQGERDQVIYKRRVGGIELADGGFHLTREQYESLVKAHHQLDQTLTDLLESGGEDWEKAWDAIDSHVLNPLSNLMPEHHRI